MNRRPSFLPTFAVYLLLLISCCLPAMCEKVDYLGLAEKAYREADYQTALMNYTKFLDEQGSVNDTPEQRAVNWRAMMRVGDCWYHLGEFGEARKWYERVITAYPDEHKACATARCGLGFALARSGKRLGALASLGKVLTDYPEQREVCANALLKMAKVQDGHREYASAANYLRKILADYSDRKAVCREASAMLVDVLDNLYETNEALGLAKTLLNSDNCLFEDKIEMLTRAVNIECGAGRPGDALATLDGFTTANAGKLVGCWQVLMLRARVFFEQKDYAKAATEYQRLLTTYEKYPYDRPNVRRQLAVSLKLAGHADEALATYNSILSDRRSAKADIIDAIDARVEMLRGQGRSSEADTERERAKALLAGVFLDAKACNDSNRLVQVAMAQSALGDKTGARATLDHVRMIDLRKGNTEFSAFMSVEYSCMIGDHSKVIQDAQEALAAFPGGTHELYLLYFLAQSYDYSGETSKALEIYERVLTKCRSAYGPRAREFACCSLLRCGIRLAEAGKKAEAMAKFEQAVRDYPATPQAKACATEIARLQGN